MADFIPPVPYSTTHIKFIIFAFVLWVLFPLIGKKLMNSNQIRIMSFVLIVLTLGQEILNDSLLMFKGLWDYSVDLPIHMCGFSLVTTSWALYNKNQTAFELSYFWGIAGASQAIFTPDLNGILNPLGLFTFFFSHTVIILNVIWLIVVDGMRLRRSALLDTILLTNGIVFIMSILNQIMGGNYWFLCQKPVSDSPFVMGEWPYYLIGIQLFGIAIMSLINFPWFMYFRNADLHNVKFAEQ